MTRKTVFCCLGLATLLLVSCGQREEPVPVQTTEGAAQPVQAEQPPATIKLGLGGSFKAPGPPEAAFTVVKTAKIQSYNYTDRSTGGTATKEAPEGQVFLIVTVEFEAIGTWTTGSQGNRAPPQGQFTVTDADGNSYSHKPYFGEKALVISPNLAKGDKFAGEILYTIPKAARGLKVQFRGRVAPRPIMAEWPID